jgi:SAM-dependent methyltransferase
MKMGFSQEWEERYADNTHLSVWPWSDIVSLVHRHCKLLIAAKGTRVLELGCGAGANIPFFLALGMDYYAIEGSQVIVTQLHQRYPNLVHNIRVGDFTADQPFDGNFDLVIDRGSLTCNNASSIKNALKIIFSALRPGGLFIGSDLYSTNHKDYLDAEIVDDKYTRTNFTKGHLIGTGKVHFFDETHLRYLFSKFEILFMEEKLKRQFEPLDDNQFASWNIVARKNV